MKEKGKENNYRTVDFFGEKREYSKNYSFDNEWNIKILSNSIQDVGKLLKEMSEIFEKSEEIDYINPNGHFISKKVN